MEGSSSGPPIPHPYPPSYRSSPSQGPPRQPAYDAEAYDYSRPPPSPSPDPGLGYGYGYPYSNPNAPGAYSGNLGSIPPRPGAYGNGERLPSDTSLKGRFDDVPVGGVNREGLAYPPNWTAEDVRAEEEFMKTGLFDWKAMASWRFWIRKSWWYWYPIIIILVALTALMTIYHDDIVKWMKPAANWVKNLPAGFTIPVVILFVISFPPLFGHEIVTIIVGVVWGLWVGFAIVAVGTFLGEVGNYYAFKYCLRSRAEKIEKGNFNYACLAHVVREGGFFIIIVARLSAIPGHFTTAVFSTCGVGVVIFSLACILSLPKQLVVVYLGVLFGENAGQKTTKDRLISYVLVGVGIIMTLWAGWYIWRQMHKARIVVWRRQRMAEKERGERKAVGGIGIGGGVPLKEFPGEVGDAEEDAEARSPMIQKGRRDEYALPYAQAFPSRDDVSPPIDFSQPQQHINPFESVDSLSQPRPFPSAHPAYASQGPYHSDPRGLQPSSHNPAGPSGNVHRSFSANRGNVVMPIAKPAYHAAKPPSAY